jgi:hypothetical protein
VSQRDCRNGCTCRPGRPNCRRSRALWDKPCRCDSYHFPHRIGSKLCQWDTKGERRLNHVAMNALAYGTG